MRYLKRRDRSEAERPAQAGGQFDVFMLFELKDSCWKVGFCKPLGQGTLPRVLRFADPGKITSLYERFGSNRLAEDRSAFEFALQQGRGVVGLSLGREQYEKLLRKRPHR